MNYNNKIDNYLNEELKIIRCLDISAINDAINIIEETRLSSGNVFLFGNGGSASTASHMVNDFNKGVSYNLNIKHNFICLNDNVATIMAIANDDSYENIFYKQIENKLKTNDIVIAISGSGNSRNVIKAVKYAKECGNRIIGMTGYDGGELKKISDISINVPIDNMQITEDMHLAVSHIMMNCLRQEIN